MKRILAALAGLTFCAVFTSLFTMSYLSREETLQPSVSETPVATSTIKQPLPKKVVISHQNNSSITTLPRPSTRTKTS